MSRRINAKSHPKSVASRKHFFARNYKRVKLLPKNAQKELGFELTKKKSRHESYTGANSTDSFIKIHRTEKQ